MCRHPTASNVAIKGVTLCPVNRGTDIHRRDRGRKVASRVTTNLPAMCPDDTRSRAGAGRTRSAADSCGRRNVDIKLTCCTRRRRECRRRRCSALFGPRIRRRERDLARDVAIAIVYIATFDSRGSRSRDRQRSRARARDREIASSSSPRNSGRGLTRVRNTRGTHGSHGHAVSDTDG